MDQKVSPKVSLDQSIDEEVSPKVSLDRKCHQKLCDLRNRESDQNLSLIKVAGNQKLCTSADFLLIKVQRLRRNLSSKFPSARWRCDKLHVEKWKSILKTSPRCDLRSRGSDQNLSEIKVAGNQKLWTNADFLLIKVQRLRRNSSSKFPSAWWRCDKLKKNTKNIASMRSP